MTNNAIITPSQAAEMLDAETAHTDIANAAHEATQAAPQPVFDEAARAPVKGPEEGVIDPAMAGIAPAPAPKLPTPIQSVGEAVPVEEAKVENLVLLKPVSEAAEANLARHIASHLETHLGKQNAEELEKALMLSVLDSPDKGKTNLVLSFQGELVAGNASLLGEQVIAALHEIPAIHALIAHHHAPHNRLHDGKLEVIVPHLSTAQYAQLIQSLAAGVEAKEVAAAALPEAPADNAKTEHACSGAGCTQCAAQGVEAVAHAKTDVVPPPADETPAHPAATVAAEAQASAEQAVSGTPAAQVMGVDHQGIANENVPARQVG